MSERLHFKALCWRIQYGVKVLNMRHQIYEQHI